MTFTLYRGIDVRLQRAKIDLMLCGAISGYAFGSEVGKPADHYIQLTWVPVSTFHFSCVLELGDNTHGA